MGRHPCVYILAKSRNGATYIGVTSDLMRRIFQHREGTFEGHAKRYGIKRLVHYEMFDDMTSAIAREKQLKAWKKDWKWALIEKDNPFWEDRAVGLGFDPLP